MVHNKLYEPCNKKAIFIIYEKAGRFHLRLESVLERQLNTPSKLPNCSYSGSDTICMNLVQNEIALQPISTLRQAMLKILFFLYRRNET